MKEIKNFTYEEIKNNFLSVSEDSRPGAYLRFSRAVTEEDIRRGVAYCAESRFGFIIPVFDEEFEFIKPIALLGKYGILLDEAEKFGIKAALNLEHGIEGAAVRFFDDEPESIRSRVLQKREYFCSAEEEVNISLPEDFLSVVAVEEHGELLDLRQYADEDGELQWKAPRGNWRICRYMCIEDDEKDCLNYLSYNACRIYLEAVLELFKNTLGRHIGKTLSIISFSDIGFSARNRRNWDEGYNTAFKSRFGRDAEPIYPCLYDCFEDDTKKYKAMLMEVRADMLKNGIMKALYDVSKENGMTLFGSICEPKLSAPSAVIGDPILCESIFPCAKLERSYLYGMNSIKVAEASAFAANTNTVGCEAFEGYKIRGKKIFYRESGMAFSRGVNKIAVHLKPLTHGKSTSLISEKEDGSYSDYVSRICSVLECGKTLYDVGVLYPIETLHSSVSLYDTTVREGFFEYPEVPDTTDYMSVINCIESCAGRPVMLLHPSVLRKELESGACKVIVLPSVSVISLDSLRAVSEFFDRGGKVIATGALPHKAAEIPKDGGEKANDEVCALIHHIFGGNAFGEIIDKNYEYNKGEGGGEAYFLYHTFIGADRCSYVPGERIKRVFEALEIPYDLIVEGPPPTSCTGALNLNYPDYAFMGLSAKIKSSGMINYIHRKVKDADVYFIGTIDTVASADIYIKGEKIPEIWDCETGNIIIPDNETVIRDGIAYTKISVNIESGDNFLIVAR